MTHEMDKITLSIQPEGEPCPWEFSNGHYCGEADDSVGIGRPIKLSDGAPVLAGCVLKREDVIKLRDFLTVCIGSWGTPPPPLFGLVRKSADLLEKEAGE